MHNELRTLSNKITRHTTADKIYTFYSTCYVYNVGTSVSYDQSCVIVYYVSRLLLNNGQRTGNSALLVVTLRSANPTDKVALPSSFPAISHTSTDNSYFYMQIPEFYFT